MLGRGDEGLGLSVNVPGPGCGTMGLVGLLLIV